MKIASKVKPLLTLIYRKVRFDTGQKQTKISTVLTYTGSCCMSRTFPKRQPLRTSSCFPVKF